MEPNRSFFAVMRTEPQKEKIIIQNILTMLSHRIYVVDETKHPLINSDITSENIEKEENGTYVFTTRDKKKWAVRIFFHKVQISSKSNIINDFLKEYSSYKKIVVAQDFNVKTETLLAKSGTQIFKEASLLQDIIAYHDQPKFEMLTRKEMDQFLAEYNATDYTTKKMSLFDPVARYFALKKGDIIRIIRPSPTSGEAIDYRIVV